MVLGGGRGRFDINRPHGSVYYSVGDSALDAAPYALTDSSIATKPATCGSASGLAGRAAEYPRNLQRRQQDFFLCELQRIARQFPL